ncbi:MAG: LysM domain-containing protein, partial [Betaproteobacteria bacterium]|nr:LysM domain-containing protein [Betaproteobacteria bacterium]
VVPTTMRPAEAAKKVGMSEADLRSMNNIPPRVVVRAGSTLLVPRSNHMPDVTEKVADNGQLSLAPEVVLKRSTVRAGRGETVASIARKYKTTAANVAEWNKVSTSAGFKPGQTVVLFLPARAKVATSSGQKADGAAKSASTAKGKASKESQAKSKSGGTKVEGKTTKANNKPAASGKTEKHSKESKKKEK